MIGCSVVHVRKDSVYGREVWYPICSLGKVFAEIAGQKTLGDKDIKLIKKLGFTVKQEGMREVEL